MARTVRIDMTGVESYSKASEGIHTAKVDEILEKTSQGGDPMLQFAFEIIKGDDKGCKVFESFSLSDKALWKFKAFLQAIGMKADGKLKIDLDKLIGKVCDIEVFHDEYNGQLRAKISDYYKVKTEAAEDDEDEEDDDDEEEEPAPPPKKKAAKKTVKKKPEPEPEDDDDDDEEDEEEDEEEEEEKPAPKKKATSKATAKKAPAATKKAAKKKPEPEPDPEDDEDEDDWEEDDE